MKSSTLVTGASRGIGAAIAAQLAGQCYGTCRPASVTSGELAETMRWITADFDHDGAIAGISSALRSYKDFQGLSGLVLNAGIAESEEICGAAVGARMIQVNLIAALALVGELCAEGLMRKGASIVFMGSNLARHGLAGKVSYAASKAGLEGATRALARELAGLSIRVNTVAPGLVETDMTRGMDEQGRAAYCEQVPAGRIGQPEDIARVVAFFLGPDSAYVNGQVLDVDGGWGA